MKKTLTVNLGGSVYHIDEDAYRLLDTYLTNLKLYFRKKESAEEIVNDIETRISELFAEKLVGGRQVVIISDVEEIINQMGKPEDFEETEEEPKAEKHSEYKATGNQYAYASASTINRRLYRNPDDRMLGGVASGIAAYLGWDVALVRVLMIIFVFIPYAPMIIAYLILWIAIPEARTAAEKLNMRGEPVTMENIGKTVTDGFERVSQGVNDYVRTGKPRSFLQRVLDVFLSIAAFIFKVFLVALVIVCFPVLFALAVALVALVIGAIAMLVGGGAVLFSWIPAISWTPLATVAPWMTVAGTMGGVLLIGIPLASFVYTLMRQLFHWQPMGAALKWALFILWIVGAAFVIINLSALNWQLPLYGLHSI